MARLRDYLHALRAHYGPLREAASGMPLEPFVRAILSPGLSPKSLDKILHTLKVYELLDAPKLRDLDADTLALALKPATNKAPRLKAFVAWFLERFDGDPERMKSVSLDRLREELLEIGLSPEAADTVLLHALGLATPVVDLPTYRVLTRHELVVEEAGYDDFKELVAREIPKAAYRDFHRLTAAVGRDFCRAKAKCEKCPLKTYLPARS